MFDEGIRLLCGFYSAESLMEDLVRIQVKRCLYKQTHVCSNTATVRIPAPLFGGGGPKSILFSLFRNKKKHHLKVFTR